MKLKEYLTESANLGNEYAIRLLQYIKSIKSNSRWSVTTGVIRLFNHMSRILQEKLEEEQKGRAMTDRKLKRKIDEKKQAHGLRQGLLDKLEDCLSLLSIEEKKLIQMIFFDELTEREIASKQGVSQVAVHKKKQRVISKIKRLFKM